MPKEIFKKSKGYDKKITVFNISDNHRSNKEKIKKIINSIMEKVDKLVE